MKIHRGILLILEKPRQYAFVYSDIENVRKEIEEFFAYRDNRCLQDGMRIFEENHPTRLPYEFITDMKPGYTSRLRTNWGLFDFNSPI